MNKLIATLLVVATTPALGGKADKELARANNAFSCDLYRTLSAPSGNLFFSPTSVSIALAMSHAGARGPTADEIGGVLHVSLPSKQLYPAYGRLVGFLNAKRAKSWQVATANGIWAAKMNLLPQYSQILKKHFKSLVSSADFKDPSATQQSVNEWVEKITRGKIKELLPAGVIDDQTRLLLVNAIYFKGFWKLPFDPAKTEPGNFHVGSGENVSVPFMHLTQHFDYGDNDLLHVLELPYRGRDLSMFVLLPKEYDGLSTIEEQLTAENLEAWFALTSDHKVRVSLPRFTIESSLSLKDALSSLGIKTAFGIEADFSGIDGTRELYISHVLHKAIVEVEEKGTTAAAATLIAKRKKNGGSGPVELNADHPFLFLIRDNRSEQILFLGRVADPSKQN